MSIHIIKTTIYVEILVSLQVNNILIPIINGSIEDLLFTKFSVASVADTISTSESNYRLRESELRIDFRKVDFNDQDVTEDSLSENLTNVQTKMGQIKNPDMKVKI